MKRSLALTAAFALLTGFSLWHHEMWLDEMQAYLLATKTTLPDLFRLMHYEAHPALWHLLVRLADSLYSAPATMQILHWLIAASTVFLFARFAPFTWPEKTLWIFGYYQSYEYAVISRNYALGVLCLALGLIFTHRQRYVAAAISWAALAHTNLFGWIICLAFLLSRAVEILWARWVRKSLPARVSLPEYFAHAVTLLALTTSWLTMYPAADYGFYLFADHHPDLGRTLTTLTSGFLPVFDRTIWFARTNWYHHILSDSAALFVALALCVWSWFMLRDHLRALLFFTAAATGMLLFFHFFYVGQSRHHGYLFLAFVAALWWARLQTPQARRTPNLPHFILLAVLLTHTLQALAAHVEDFKRPFSRARDAAAFLAQKEFTDAVIVADPDYYGTAISGYLKRPLVSSKSGRLQTYMVWNKTSYGTVSRAQLLGTAASFSDRRVIVVVAGKLRANELRGAPLRLLQAFEGAIIPHEDFYLFEYAPAAHQPAKL